MSELETKIREVIAESFDIDVEKVKLESSFQEDLDADSLDIIELVMALEEEFGIEIPDDEVESIKTVQLAVDYIKNNQ